MDDATLIILAIAGVASVLLFAMKGLIDQLPEFFISIGRALDAWRELWSTRPEEVEPEEVEPEEAKPDQAETDEAEPVEHQEDQEPPAAA